MRATARRVLAGTGLAVSLTLLSSLATPTPASSFDLLGGSLNTNQRDFRVFNNFTDGTANNNVNPQSSFPGALGAVLSIWKGHVEWASEPYAGSGAGDFGGSNPILGSGGANFDNIYLGETNSIGSPSDKIHSELDGCSGSTLAFTVPGWQIRYYSCWQWRDGPGSEGGTDLQGVACHEIGHSLGLGHSNFSSATMFPSIIGSGVGARSIATDDINGVRAIYGVAAGDKPRITGLSNNPIVGEILTITGQDFTANDNEVWYTRSNGNGTPGKILNVSSTNGSTRIDVTIPADAIDGEVMVKRDGSGFGSDLSNAFPIDIDIGVGPPPVVQNVSPSSGPEGGFTVVTIGGQSFGGTNSVTFGGVPALSFTVVTDNSITAVTPAGSGTVAVTVTDGAGSDTLNSAYTYTPNPALDVDTVTPDQGPEAGGTTVTITGPSVLGATSATFDGVPGTGFQIVDAGTISVDTPAGAGTVDVAVTGTSGSDTLSGAFTYIPPAQGAFVQYGTGTGGALGVPTLSGSGDLAPGSMVGYQYQISGGLSFAPVLLLVGVNEADLPLIGHQLALFPILLQIPIGNTSISGNLTLPATIPAGTPSVSIYHQAWLTDATGPNGFSTTNGLRLDIP